MIILYFNLITHLFYYPAEKINVNNSDIIDIYSIKITLKEYNMNERIQKKLWYMRESHGIVGVKGGTEVEDMTFEELNVLREISQGIVPMIVKIGGPEARNDMRHCLNINVDGILAPMIESEYGFINFIDSLKEIAGKKMDSLYLAINLETITGYCNLNPIIQHPYFSQVHQVTVGRTDLAGSMEYPVNHKEVQTVTSDIVKRVREKGKLTSVGGKIDVVSALSVKEHVSPDRINTRHLVIDLNKSKNLTYSVCEALSFEIELYKLFMSINSDKIDSYVKRMDDTKMRITVRDTNFSFVST